MYVKEIKAPIEDEMYLDADVFEKWIVEES